jgi:hypothetical protein
MKNTRLFFLVMSLLMLLSACASRSSNWELTFSDHDDSSHYAQIMRQSYQQFEQMGFRSDMKNVLYFWNFWGTHWLLSQYATTPIFCQHQTRSPESCYESLGDIRYKYYTHNSSHHRDTEDILIEFWRVKKTSDLQLWRCFLTEMTNMLSHSSRCHILLLDSTTILLITYRTVQLENEYAQTIETLLIR